jgi:hypothetical protein
LGSAVSAQGSGVGLVLHLAPNLKTPAPTWCAAPWHACMGPHAVPRIIPAPPQNLVPTQGLNEQCARELDVIGEQFPFQPLKFLPKSLRLEFAEGIQMLQEAGYDVSCGSGGLVVPLPAILPAVVRPVIFARMHLCDFHAGGPLWRPEHRAGARSGQAC